LLNHGGVYSDRCIIPVVQVCHRAFPPWPPARIAVLALDSKCQSLPGVFNAGHHLLPRAGWRYPDLLSFRDIADEAIRLLSSSSGQLQQAAASLLKES
jgi:hypothetical protein